MSSTFTTERTDDVFIDDENITFESLHLKKDILRGLNSAGFIKPSPIQLRAIPFGRLGSDLIAQAKSGTGKTCVFTVILLESLNLNNLCPQSLVLAPTREIAVQIRDVIRKIGKYMKDLECHSFIGGIPVTNDKTRLNLGCHIIIGTPGRINQLLNLNLIQLNSISQIVLDEADELFTESFKLDIKNIILTISNALNNNIQTMAFSASFFDKIDKEISQYMKNPKYILLNNVKPSLKGVKQYFIVLNNMNSNNNNDFSMKFSLLLKILNSSNFHQCIVFTNNKNRSRDISDSLTKYGYPSCNINSEQLQKDRLLAINKLRQFKIRILVSSDLTSRGIDISSINLIINLDLPYNCQTYLHRVGRTGRYGTYGKSVTILSGNKERIMLDNYIKTLNSKIHKFIFNSENNKENDKINNPQLNKNKQQSFKKLKKKEEKFKNKNINTYKLPKLSILLQNNINENQNNKNNKQYKQLQYNCNNEYQNQLYNQAYIAARSFHALYG